jgi:cytochrome c
MSSKVALYRTLSVLGILLLLAGLMAFPPQGPQPSSAAVYDYSWRDDFASTTLHPLWSWVREDATHWSLDANSGFLRITTQTDWNNILVADAPSGDFQITTKVTVNPTENFQHAAIQVYQDDANYIQLNRAYADGNNVNFDRMIGGVAEGIQVAEETDTLWLRIAREGTTYTAFTSPDGAAWMQVGQHTATLTHAKISLAAGNVWPGVPEIPADYDYFELEAMWPNFGTSWNDDFAATTVDPAWTWINEDTDFWSLTDNPGYMRLTTYDGGMVAKNLLIQPAPVGNYAITTRVLFEPTSNFQMAGLVVYAAPGNILSFGRAHCDSGPPLCVGNGIYFDNVDVTTHPNFATAVPDLDVAVLRLVREGLTYSGYYSVDGIAWELIGRHTADASRGLAHVGVSCGQDSADIKIPADFDYVELLHDYANFLPVVIRNY